MTIRSRHRHDVVIVGAGPAGCATAIELRRLEVERVVLVDRSQPRVELGESLPPDTRLLLERLGAWNGFVADEHEPAWGSCSAWGSDELGYNDFVCNPHGHGWHIERGRFERLLRRRAESLGATVSVARVDDVISESGGFVCTTDRDPIHARFVVDATGPTARVARRLGAIRVVDDRLTCAAGFFDRSSDSGLNRLTMLEAVEDGWWYAARLPNDRAVAVAAFDADTSAPATEVGWHRRLAQTRHVGPALAGARFVSGSLGVRTAPTGRAVPTAGEGWVAIGDASVSFDPLLARGIHQALAGGLRAGGAVAAMLQGDPTGVDALVAEFDRTYHEATSNRCYFYDIERRWPRSDFWAARRHSSLRPADRRSLAAVT